jgi:hypothetical protein
VFPFRLRAASLPLLLVGLACGSPPAAPPPTVEYAGCGGVFEPGGRCILGAKRELRLWIAAPQEKRIELRVDDRQREARGTPVREGRRFTLTIPPGARRVDVRVAGPRPTGRWSLVLAEPRDQPSKGSEGRPAASRDIVAEIDGKTRQVYYQLRARDLAAARTTLADLHLPAKAPAESRYLMSYYRGMLAEREGDYRAALAEVRSAVEIAERVKAERHQWLAEEEEALLLLGVGRSREAALLFARLRQAPHAKSPCETAQLLNNLAWAMLLAREAGEGLGDPAPLLQEALAKYEICAAGGPEQKVNALINLALADLQASRLPPARELLARAHALEPHPPLPHRLWWLDLEGRIALAEGRPRAALERFDQLEELAAETSSFDGRLRAALGQARSHQTLGESGAALEVLGQAEDLLDEQSLQIPIDQGRETFLAARQSIVGLHLGLLLDQGRTREALAAARHARARVLRQLAHVDSLGSLPAEARARRARLLTAYQQRRAALEERARDDWKLPGDQLRQERAARKAEAEALRTLLDEAYRLLEEGGGGAAAGLPALRGDELMLVVYPLAGSGWVCFAADLEGVAAHRFELPGAQLPAAEELARLLLLPFRERIERAARLRILASGRLESIDFHALPLGGKPLVAVRPVVYGLDLPVAGHADRRAERRALLVTDPRGDLPGARREARTVRKMLAAASPSWQSEELQADDASAAAVRARLAAVDLLHYAGHGDYAGLGGWESSLLLADGTRLTLGDLLALGRVPRWVVLSGCDTGRASAETPVSSLGLAHAFLLAGSRAVVASTRPADDRAVPAFFSELYRQWDREPDLAVAMQRAQLAWRQRDPAADWSLFRLFER